MRPSFRLDKTTKIEKQKFCSRLKAIIYDHRLKILREPGLLKAADKTEHKKNK